MVFPDWSGQFLPWIDPGVCLLAEIGDRVPSRLDFVIEHIGVSVETHPRPSRELEEGEIVLGMGQFQTRCSRVD
jgi:hypothetical protein